MSGTSAEESSKNINKIISNVAKQVVIDKTGRDTLPNP
jgi:predicted metallo-beta-lactamase superfamily hydrolase